MCLIKLCNFYCLEWHITEGQLKFRQNNLKYNYKTYSKYEFLLWYIKVYLNYKKVNKTPSYNNIWLELGKNACHIQDTNVNLPGRFRSSGSWCYNTETTGWSYKCSICVTSCWKYSGLVMPITCNIGCTASTLHKDWSLQYTQCMYNVTLRRFCATIVAVEKQ